MTATPGRRTDPGTVAVATSPRTHQPAEFDVQAIPVARIRPEEGLGRRRDRDGHRDLRNSIEQFGVLTPITVRLAPDCSGDYLLIKGQGRTLACQILGLKTIPGFIVDTASAEDEKVQQFLVENVARLRMRPIDRALLISRARSRGEETSDVARRFGVSAATVRRLEGQLDGASKSEVAALKTGNVNLALHAVIARHVDALERGDIVAEVANYSLRTREIDELFRALGWEQLAQLGAEHSTTRLMLIAWACRELSHMDAGTIGDRLGQLGECLPVSFQVGGEQQSRSASAP